MRSHSHRARFGDSVVIYARLCALISSASRARVTLVEFFCGCVLSVLACGAMLPSCCQWRNGRCGGGNRIGYECIFNEIPRVCAGVVRVCEQPQQQQRQHQDNCPAGVRAALRFINVTH